MWVDRQLPSIHRTSQAPASRVSLDLTRGVSRATHGDAGVKLPLPAIPRRDLIVPCHAHVAQIKQPQEEGRGERGMQEGRKSAWEP